MLIKTVLLTEKGQGPSVCVCVCVCVERIGSIFFTNFPYLTCSPHDSTLVVLARVNRRAVAL